MLPDLRFALRTLRRSPVFTLVAVLSLALGIGANTAIFRLIDAALLKSLPVRAPGELFSITPINRRGETDGFSYPLARRIAQNNPAFSALYAASSGTSAMDLTALSGAPPQKVNVELVTGEYFDVLGVNPFAGRLLTPASHDESVAVLSHRFWKSAMDRDYSALGRSISLDGHPLRIIGIAPPEFFGDAVGEAPDLWVRAEMQPQFDRGASLLEAANSSWLRVMGRLRPGVTASRAQAASDVLLQQIQTANDPVGKSAQHYMALRLEPGARGFSGLRARFSRPLQIVMAIVGLLLLIACANVANLLLARASARRKEIAIRLAIGATRWRLVRQMLLESLLLGSLGGVLGILLALWGSRVLLLLVSGSETPIPLDVQFDAPVLLFTLAISLLASLSFGLLPAATATRARVAPKLSHMRPLVVLQVALSLLLITAAGLFVRTLRNLRAVDLGFAAEQVVQVSISPANSGYRNDQVLAVETRIADRLRSLPGVLSVGMAATGFRSGDSNICCIAVEGYQPNAGEDRRIRAGSMTPSYLSTMGMTLVAGRAFLPQDVPHDKAPATSVLVNQAFARFYFGTGPAVGRRFGWGDPPNVRYRYEIAGVVGDSIWDDLRSAPPKMVYFPAPGGDRIAIRTAADPSAMLTAVRAAIRQEDAGMRIYSLTTIPLLKEQALAQDKLVSRLAAFFGLAALLLAALGLYGVMSYGVVRRRQEIGIRMALGAQPLHVVRLVAGDALTLVAVGSALGLAGVAAGGRLVASQLFHVKFADPVTIASASALLLAVAAAAAWLPVRRATLVDPTITLRSE